MFFRTCYFLIKYFIFLPKNTMQPHSQNLENTNNAQTGGRGKYKIYYQTPANKSVKFWIYISCSSPHLIPPHFLSRKTQSSHLHSQPAVPVFPFSLQSGFLHHPPRAPHSRISSQSSYVPSRACASPTLESSLAHPSTPHLLQETTSAAFAEYPQNLTLLSPGPPPA